MKKSDLTNYLLENYDAFYLMTRSVAMLGSEQSKKFTKDSERIIDFIGKVYSWETEYIQAAIDLILGEMMRIALMSDYHALASSELLASDIKNNMVFYEIKGAALEEVNYTEVTGGQTGYKYKPESKDEMCYNTFSHMYEPKLRFAQIRRLASHGNVASVMQEAIMLILGIGCKSNIIYAQQKLQNLLIWGEPSAAMILSFLWGREGDAEESEYYKSIFKKISGEQNEFDYKLTDVNKLYILISAIQSSIINVLGKREIDVFFADTMNREDISFSDKLYLIKKYKDGSWIKYIFDRKERVRLGF